MAGEQIKAFIATLDLLMGWSGIYTPKQSVGRDSGLRLEGGW